MENMLLSRLLKRYTRPIVLWINTVLPTREKKAKPVAAIC